MKTTTQMQILGLANGGAVLTIPAKGANVLVGHLVVLDDRTLFFFEAWGETGFAGHLLPFAAARVPHPLGVEFLDKSGNLVAYLTTIEEADGIDRAAHRASFNAWQKELPVQLGFIEEIRRQLTAEEEEE